MITKIIEYHPPIVGMTSCVGILGKDFPLNFGNYFWLDSGLRIVNMWSENLKELIRKNDYQNIECTVFISNNGIHALGFITDSRIPKDWLIKDRLCVTGYGWGSRELAEAALGFAGFSPQNHICGCELPEESPRISQMITFSPRSCTYTCHRCKREWND